MPSGNERDYKVGFRIQFINTATDTTFGERYQNVPGLTFDTYDHSYYQQKYP
jgi:hypothetical protein